MSSVYVDSLRPCTPSKKWRYTQSCHLVSDSLEALHAFAERIGLKRCWFENHKLMPHYDLTPGKRAEAIAAGALPISFNRLYGMIQERKAA